MATLSLDFGTSAVKALILSDAGRGDLLRTTYHGVAHAVRHARDALHERWLAAVSGASAGGS
jgi:hypothetical protein